MQKGKKDQSVDLIKSDMVKMLFDAVTDMGIIITDMDKKIVLYNAAASFYDRIDQKTAIGMYYYEIYKDDDGGFIQRVMKEGKPILNQPESYRYADGRIMTTVDSIYPVYSQGRMVYVISFTHYDKKVRQALDKAFRVHVTNNRISHKERGSVRYAFHDIIGSSKQLRMTLNRAMRAAGSSAPVFLEGETGTGKELFAQSIHSGGSRADKPFVAVNCAAIPENLLESTLFGTTKGSFTGAENKAGLFEEAKDGTFFLDEINSMPLILQAKLLRVIQERKVRRIGAQNEVDIHCRIIASCNQKTDECIANGSLRNDLYYRLSVIKLEIPPLRQRKEDIREYLDAFLEKFSRLYECSVTQYTPEFYEALQIYDWPGNVRELEHVVESSVVMLNDKRILDLADLPANIIACYYSCKGLDESDTGLVKAEAVTRSGQNYETAYEDMSEKDLYNKEMISSEEMQKSDKIFREYLREQEREMLIRTLEEYQWNITHTAEAMGMSRSSLQYRMRKFGIAKPEENKKI